MRIDDVVLSFDSYEKELWYVEIPDKPKKKKCKKPSSQCNCNFRGRGKFVDV